MTDEQQIPGEVSQGRKGPSISVVLFLVVAALAAVFFLQNNEAVNVDFLVFEKDTTIRWSLLMATALGILLDRIFSIWWRRRRRRKNP